MMFQVSPVSLPSLSLLNIKIMHAHSVSLTPTRNRWIVELFCISSSSNVVAVGRFSLSVRICAFDFIIQIKDFGNSLPELIKRKGELDRIEYHSNKVEWNCDTIRIIKNTQRIVAK